MKTVIGIVGSPRKGGNTDILVRQVLAGAAAEGDETKIFYLEDLEYQGCQGCRYCKMNEGCRVEDDMTLLYQELIAADGIVLGTPVYFGQMSGQTKLFLDRWYALMNPDFSSRLPAGKKMVLVVGTVASLVIFRSARLRSTMRSISWKYSRRMWLVL